jgi:hypothetical protein
MRLYINGVRVTNFLLESYPSSGASWYINTTNLHAIGRYGSSQYFDGYMTEVNFIDGQALTPSSFGTTDAFTGAWIPMAYTGTYGTNGFYLDFRDNTSTTTLGLDYSGNANNWTANNISLTAGSTYDSMLDVPTPWVGYNTGDVAAVTRGNYATLNPLATKTALTTVSSGNLNMVSVDASNAYTVPATILMQSGKWYFEGVATGTVTIAYPAFGIQEASTPFATTNGIPGAFSGYKGFSFFPNGYFSRDNVATSVAFSYTTNDVIGYCIDIDAGKAWVSKNGTWLQSGDPANGTSPNYTFTAGTAMYMCAGNLISAGSCSVNFGQRPFSYTPPSGFKTLVTTNLPEPTIKLGASYMAASTYTGTGATLSIVNSGNNTTATTFAPDFVWLKSRGSVQNNSLFDSVRGVGNYLWSNLTNAETNSSSALTAFNSNGFSISSSSDVNQNATTFIGWQWKAAGSTVSNTSGTITSTVSANTTAGFSIVTYTGTGANATVGHGLGVVPEFIIWKRRNATSNWISYNKTSGNGFSLYLDLTNANTGSSYLNSTSPNSSVITMGTNTDNNGNGGTYVAYCFAAVAGYSAFGSYTGNASADGPFVYLGFRPRYIMIKRTDSTGDWSIIDTSRSTYNQTDNVLWANLSNADSAGQGTDILSNGFKLRSTGLITNASGGTYIYAAFAENPFKYSNAR